MLLQNLYKEGDAYREIHDGEHLVALGSEAQLSQAALMLGTLIANWNMQIDTLIAPENEMGMRDAKREAMKLLRDDPVKRLLILNQDGGVTDRVGKIIPLLTREKLEAILQGGECAAPLHPRMRAELGIVADALEVMPKATITSADELPGELYSWMGAGSLAVNREKLTMGSINPHEIPIFNAMYDYQVKEGKFRPRPPQEFINMRNAHSLLRIDKSPIGGASFLKKNDAWTELCAFWASTEGHGIVPMLLDQVPNSMQETDVYALSTDPGAIALFRKHGVFQNMGVLSKHRSDLPETLQTILQNYKTTKRDPEVFIAMKNAA